jgi:predicted metal-binding membrane protein
MITRAREAGAVPAEAEQPATTVAALIATFAVAAVCWVVAIRQMAGMDMGVGTELGSFGFFVVVWVVMMAAMMLPGAAPAIVRRVRARGVLTVPPFLVSYLSVWAIVGLAIYAVYRPHGTSAAAAIVIAAGAYELTPIKRHFRRRCRAGVESGVVFGIDCVGSSIGLMLMLAALGVMSVTWMALAAVLIASQKLLPARAALDVPLGLAIVGFGILIAMSPESVPGLTPPMM